MTLDATVLVACAVVYLGLLFLVAEAAERGWIPARLARHRWVSALSLGVYASTWTYYGSVGYARSEGLRFLTIYLGVSLACLLVPVVWVRILHLSRKHQLASLPDLFAFRYGSPAAGVAVTLFYLAGSLPYLALQIRAVSSSIAVLTGGGSPAVVGLVFTAAIAVFAVLFGVRYVTAREKHDGLVLAIALESVVKLVALLTAAAFALFHVLGGPSGLADWLRAHPEALDQLYRPVREGPWGSLLLLSFAAAFLLPRQYHMAFTESRGARSLRSASWLFPVFLLLLNVAIPPILWAGTVIDPNGNPDLYLLRVSMSGSSSWLPIFVFVGGVSAASAMIIVTVLALSSMCLNHLVLPLGRPSETDLYAGLRWSRRGIVVVLLFGAYCLFLALADYGGLVELGLVAFVAVAQFLPGVVGVLFWRQVQARPLLIGLCAGIAGWFLFELMPLLARSHLLPEAADLPARFGITGSDQLSFATFASLGVNATLTVFLSLIREPTAQDEALARACVDAGAELPAERIEASAPDDFARALAPTLGPDLAAREVARALADVGLPVDEPRPAALRRLRDQLRRNLSGLLGPVAARDLVGQAQGAPPVGEKLLVLERELARSSASHRSLSAELEQFRRYLRDVFQDLPVGACAVGAQDDVVLWNRAMVEITGIADERVAGAELGSLPAPWGPIFAAFARDPAAARRLTVPLPDGREGRFHLRKSQLSRPFGAPEDDGAAAGLVLLLEDRTERATLEAKLEHHERLALIGQLAASVAHEIGNPLAAISSVAQNLQRELADEEARARLQTIRDQIARIHAIVKSLVVYSRAGTEAARAPASRFSLAEAVDEAVSLVRLDPRGQAQSIENGCPADLRLWGDRPRLIQVFINLLQNACDASPAGGRIVVRGRAEDGRALVEIADCGAGVPPELRERIFEPFFTTKIAGKGTGLGLSLAYSIVRDHDGTLDVQSEPGAGTTVTLSLPRGEESA